MKILKNVDKILLFITVLLFVIGSIMVFSASNVSFYMRYATSPYKFFVRQLLILVIGLVVSLFIIFINVRTISKFSTFASYCLMISLSLLFVFGEITNSAQSWFGVGAFNIQPSEFLKVFAIIWLAKYYDSKKKNFSSYVTTLYPILLCFLAFFAIAAQPDLGTAVIFFLIVGFIFLLSKVDSIIKKRIVGVGVGLVVVAVLVVLVGGKSFISDRQMSRITSVLSSSPCSEEHYYTDGNQVCNGYIAINNGGLKGMNLGKSIQKYLYLPEAHTDFIFCIIIEELGLVSGIFIILLYILLLFRIILIGKRSLNNRDAIICYGGAFYIFIHILVNLCGVLGLLPMTGVPLPFMSYGGSYALCLMIILAVIQRINVETKLRMANDVGKNK